MLYNDKSQRVLYYTRWLYFQEAVVVIHKIGKQKVTRYGGLGQYEQVPSPLCVGAKAVYAGKSYYVHRNWAKVTCKHCLAKR